MLDYQSPATRRHPHEIDTLADKPNLTLLWIIAGLILLALSWELFLQDNSFSTSAPTESQLAPLMLPAQLPEIPTASPETPPALETTSTQPEITTTPSPAPAAIDTWHSHIIQPGDSFYQLMAPYHLPANNLHLLMKDKRAKTYLTQLRPNHKLSVFIEDNVIKNILYQLNQTQALVISYANGAYRSSITRSIQEAELSRVTGVINSNLFNDAKQAGLTNKVIMQLSHIFSWKIDFARQIRPGDSFSVLYARYPLADGTFQPGDILAATMTIGKQQYQAVRFVDKKGISHYYTPKGESMESAFLRTPVNYKRISSTFSRGRMHPVLHVHRPHYGVDLAARSGTPIKAASDGIVSFIGRKGGYGKIVILNHTHRYSTRYAHMSRFRSKLHTGSRVKRGDVIGYVGMTGLADGPHLHYEVRIRNRPYNPLTVKLPSGAPIAKADNDNFSKQASYYLSLLDDPTAKVT